MDKIKRLTISIISITGFILETITIFLIATATKTMFSAIMFFLLFGLIRRNSAEHYKYWIKCMIGTTTIFICFLVLSDALNLNIFFNLILCSGISYLFRESK